jgi:REP element-mobilizing transposase RayT
VQLDAIAQAIDRFGAQVLALCQMGNQYHLVLHTPQANLSRLMRHVNGVDTPAFNRRLAWLGTCFKGASKALAVCNNHRAQALLMACTEGGMTMTALAKEAGISVTHIGRLIARAETR